MTVIRLGILAFAAVGMAAFALPSPGYTHAQDVIGGELCAAVAVAVLATFVLE